MDADEVALVGQAVSRLAEAHDGPDLTRMLDDFGWLDILSSEPDVGVPAVFGAQGRSGTWSAALHDVLAGGLPELGLQSERACVVLPRPRSVAPGRLGHDGVRVHGLLLGPRRDPSSYVIPVSFDDEDIGAVLEVPARTLVVEPQRGLDPGLDLFEVSGAAGDGHVVAEGATATKWWEKAQANARLALAHCMAGGLNAMLELARVHATERAQFGRLIGTFQAVRHKLAETYVSIAAIESTAAAAWEADDLPLAAATAKLVASRAGATSVAHTQQVLAGIGFTAEHRYHRLMKRVVVLDRVLGNADELAPLVGRRLIGRADAPRLVQL